MAELKLGLIGAGRIGRVHAQNIASRVDGAALVAVTDVAAEAAKSLAEVHSAKVFEEPENLLSADLDAVLICSSSDTHAQFISLAAKAGKHVFCEKPIALELSKIDAALADVEAAGVKLQVGFNRRFDANFAAIREAVTRGDIGEVHMVRVTSRDPEPPPLSYVKISGGLFLDMTIHDFDMARFLADSEVEEVYATGAALIDPAVAEVGDIDSAVISLRFVSGALGSIDALIAQNERMLGGV